MRGRKKGVRNGIIVLCVAFVIGLVSGFITNSDFFLKKKVAPETFASKGLEITLTNEFEEVSYDGFTVSFASEEMAVFALQEKFAVQEGFEELSLQEYGEVLLGANSMSIDELKSDNGLTYFERTYNNPDTNETYEYFCVVYKADDAFWLVQFAALDDIEEYRSDIIEWAKTVKFL